jgi:hypothetical protein
LGYRLTPIAIWRKFAMHFVLSAFAHFADGGEERRNDGNDRDYRRWFQ